MQSINLAQKKRSNYFGKDRGDGEDTLFTGGHVPGTQGDNLITFEVGLRES